MKIVFFKNEAHFHPRISYVWENAEKVNLNSKLQNLKNLFMWILAIPFLAFLIINFEKLTSKWLLLLVITLLCLPIHELCHALFCWISGRQVERICFFPYKQVFSKVNAYVKPAFSVWNKYQTILFYSFPIIMLSIIPVILTIFIVPLRPWLLYLSLLNIGVSYSDIMNILCFIKTPRRSLYFGDFILTVKDADNPITIHQLSITPKPDKIHHRCFEYFNDRLTEKEQIFDTAETRRLKQEFKQQFNLE